MKVERIPNKDARVYVAGRMPFRGSNLYGERFGECYVVYSYGEHWPLFFFDGHTWFVNGTKNSITTGRHRSQAHPAAPVIEFPCGVMKALVERARREQAQAEKAS